MQVYKAVHPFSKFICPKLNPIASMEFEIVYNNIASTTSREISWTEIGDHFGLQVL